MCIAEFSHKIELSFWNWLIPTLSASPLLQKMVRHSYRFVRVVARFRWYLLSVLVSVCGFINGVLVFKLIVR
jgi:hypothetical protein